MKAGDTRLFEIQHLTEFEYELPLQRAVMLLRLAPASSGCQTVSSFSYEFVPDAQIVELTDSFGNICHLIDFHSTDQSAVTIRSCSTVKTTDPCHGELNNVQVAWDKLDESQNTIDYWEFMAPSSRVYDCQELRDFMSSNHLTRGADVLIALKQAAECLHQKIRYQPGATNVNTSIEECLKIGSGVCQDFTHIMAAIGRNWKIPSRYVSGYLHLLAETSEAITEEASHAWAEFLLPQVGWVGVDATNNTIVDNRYIRLAAGRDYQDVAPTKGVVFGGGESTLSVSVKLTYSNPDQAAQTEQ